MGKASTRAKDKYNRQKYVRYSFRVEQEDYLNDQIQEYMSYKNSSLNYLIIKLLRDHFGPLEFDALNSPETILQETPLAEPDDIKPRPPKGINPVHKKAHT